MHIGSVRFYKHLILTTLALMIVVPTCLSVFFGIKSYSYKKQAEEYYQLLSQQADIGGTDMAMKNMSVTGEGLSPSFSYQDMYPDMYVERLENPQYLTAEDIEKPVVYLTFDDGPSKQTEQVLSILSENDIKATFFVVNTDIEDNQQYYKRIAEEGHTLGIHTYSHRYTQIYSSVEAYLDDFYQMFNKVYQLTGAKPTVFRFPGGSINNYNRNVYMQIVAEMTRRGFTYYDWNVASGDVGVNNSQRNVYNAVIQGVQGKDFSIVLMHDSAPQYMVPGALTDIINTLKDTHQFLPITQETKPITFTYTDNGH